MKPIVGRAILAGLAVTCAFYMGACGGTSGNVVARVGERSITRGEVDHWMSTLAGGDFYELSHKHTVPAGLASDPPNYSLCVERLATAAKEASTAPRHPTAVELLTKCRELYQGLKQQATAYLVEAQWRMAADAEDGIKVSGDEVTRFFDKVKKEEFPTAEDQKRYFAARRRTVDDEMLIVKLDVLSQHFTEKLRTEGRRALVRFEEAGRRVTARTSCRPGYVVRHCREYTGEPVTPAQPATSVLMEQVARLTGEPCVNRAACGEA